MEGNGLRMLFMTIEFRSTSSIRIIEARNERTLFLREDV